jgi:cell division protease FtsH
MSIAKSKAKLQISNVKFKDVAGYEELKTELKELVDYLKMPEKFRLVGAKTPKGVLMVGPPGTGKTLFAKAVAGEANVPFFTVSGSDFVEMFIGVGASRVRNMFKVAKEAGKCLIFIDEIDAVGRARGAGVGGGNDEREQTLNQLLVEMDGFNNNSGIIVLAATNRADVLDPALIRPGRFDRQVSLRLPDVKEREAILRVHLGKKQLSSKVSLEDIASRTPGFSGAQLENILNEAAILAVREDQDIITTDLIDEAIDRTIGGGPAKRSKVVSPEEKKIIAYHEAGHAIIGLKLKDAHLVQKITIIPRGDAGGYVLMTPKKEKMIQTKAELIANITSYLGGRASEEIFFGKDNITTGASADIQSATKIARAMVTELGMSDLGPIQFEESQSSVFLGRELGSNKQNSSKTQHEIDMEIKKIIMGALKLADQTIRKHKKLLIKIAEHLIVKEIITAEVIRYIEKHDKIPPKDFFDASDKEKADAKKAREARIKKEQEAKMPKPTATNTSNKKTGAEGKSKEKPEDEEPEREIVDIRAKKAKPAKKSKPKSKPKSKK